MVAPTTGILQLNEPLEKYLPQLKPVAKTVDEAIIGVEFENEIRTNDAPFTGMFGKFGAVKNWKYHDENSLRYYGFEFVSRPVPIPTFKLQTLDLFKNMAHQIAAKEAWYLPDKPLPLTNSTRTSVHVHFDVMKYTTVQLINFVSLYWIMEPFLQHFCGSWRQGNLFCLRAKDSSYIKIILSDILASKKPLLKSTLVNESYRYASVNFNSLTKFGTIEFRLMRGVSDPFDAFLWVDALEAIRKFALQYPSTDALKSFFMNEVDAADLPKYVLGAELYLKIKKSFPKNESLGTAIRDGWMSISSIMRPSTSWDVKYLETLRKKVEDERAARLIESQKMQPEFIDLIMNSEYWKKGMEDHSLTHDQLWSSCKTYHPHPILNGALKECKISIQEYRKAFFFAEWEREYVQDYEADPHPPLPSNQLTGFGAAATINTNNAWSFGTTPSMTSVEAQLIAASADASSLGTYKSIYGMTHTMTQTKLGLAAAMVVGLPLTTPPANFMMAYQIHPLVTWAKWDGAKWINHIPEANPVSEGLVNVAPTPHISDETSDEMIIDDDLSWLEDEDDTQSEPINPDDFDL
jgi:hypothetical protein